MSLSRKTPADFYNWVNEQLGVIKNLWDDHHEEAKEKLKTVFNVIKANSMILTASAWKTLMTGISALLTGVNMALDSLVKFVVDHQTELQAAQTTTASFFKGAMTFFTEFDKERAGKAFWLAAADFGHALHPDLYDAPEQASIAKKRN